MSEKPAATPPASPGSQSAAPAAAGPDAHELEERLRGLRDRVVELRGRL
jgi:hypothetical protein